MHIKANAHSPGVALLRHVAEDKQSAKQRGHDGERGEIKRYYSLHTSMSTFFSETLLVTTWRSLISPQTLACNSKWPKTKHTQRGI